MAIGRTFDAEADGMVRGNGMAFIVLKKLDEALKDGDNIHAVIKASAITNDGQDKIGFTAPSVEGQAAAIEKAYRKAQIDPATVSYIEAHGTGTRIGDPIEIAGLTKAFRQFTNQKQFCAIGSVKVQYWPFGCWGMCSRNYQNGAGYAAPATTRYLTFQSPKSSNQLFRDSLFCQ